MEIAPSITQHTIVLCVEKRERGIGMQQILTKVGFRVIMALSLYDALKFIAQEMPHLVITEALLSDGTAGTLYDRLQQHQQLKKTPILVQVLKKTKEELAPLAGRKFGGFLLGAADPKGFLAKVLEVLRAHSVVSPYFISAEEGRMQSELTIAIEANVVGRSGEQVVSRSATEVDPAAAMVCIPDNSENGPAVFRMASNLREGDEIFNLFPINRIVGAGRKWVLNLPEIKLGKQEQAAQKQHKVLFFDPSEERANGFAEILKGYGIDLLYAKSLNAAASMLKRDFEDIEAIYLFELMNDASGIEWKNAVAKVPADRRPPMIVGTSSINARSTTAVRYIKRPFGMGLFVEMLQASFERGRDIANAAGKGAASSFAGVPVKYQAQANLVGIDETGGIIQMKFPLLKGSKMILKHPQLEQAWDGNTVVSITGSSALPNKPDIWQARFEAVQAGTSKAKYWEKVARIFETATSEEKSA
jgi:DNA-binding response OmpR family regulator